LASVINGKVQIPLSPSISSTLHLALIITYTHPLYTTSTFRTPGRHFEKHPPLWKLCPYHKLLLHPLNKQFGASQMLIVTQCT